MRVLLQIVMMCLGAAPGTADLEKDGVRLGVTVVGSRYAYRIENTGVQPVTRFEIGHFNTYNYEVPDGWKCAVDPHRIALTPDDAEAAGGTREMEFSMRVASAGAVLGLVPARVWLGNGQVVSFDRVWAPQPEPWRTVVVVPIVIAFVILVHTMMLARGDRKAAVKAEAT